MRIALAAALLCAASAAQALTPAQLGRVGVAPPAGARLPLDAAFTAEDGRARTLGEALSGRPALLMFADYTCTSLCGTALGLSAAALRGSGLVPGRDYAFVVVGLDPKDGAAASRTMRERELAGLPALAAAAQFLHADAATLAQLTPALGYRYVYDPQHDQFAHPLAVFALSREGQLSRMLDALSLTRSSVRDALAAAGRGEAAASGWATALRRLCYGFDPLNGRYTRQILRLLSVAAGLTLLLLAACLFLTRRGGPRSPA